MFLFGHKIFLPSMVNDFPDRLSDGSLDMKT
jgi:hypothetical protein